ncbi:ribonuclease P protein component [Arcticibacter tournemirensis]|uniref:Ribonuclease P protein component n=1 Tax=Arcticibacter tournemirensis TaxID=699437 RepID=A0A4V1KHZ2_9SPHI|nr:ribonuclease P protein component [Arcticibacter tournemirensis]KAA8484148.1 ribonuclease P protein component [Arcticibacter tournemirensis]RXF68882.1 ribonuclease P protein component [Arcticibacter tournemirensis]TQM51893.1 ribonuclease P protein component [Arcticibacter tournemirensis]
MYTFKKEERLCSKKLLSKLFSNGSSFLVYPFRVVHIPESGDLVFPSQVVIIVPKRRFKHANERNLIKRRIRESYRLHKEEFLYSFLREHNLKLLLSLQYIGKEIVEYKVIEKKLLLVFKQLNKAYAEAGSQSN